MNSTEHEKATAIYLFEYAEGRPLLLRRVVDLQVRINVSY